MIVAIVLAALVLVAYAAVVLRDVERPHEDLWFDGDEEKQLDEWIRRDIERRTRGER